MPRVQERKGKKSWLCNYKKGQEAAFTVYKLRTHFLYPKRRWLVMSRNFVKRIGKPILVGMLVAVVATMSPIGLQFNRSPQDVSSPDLTLGQYQFVLTIGTDVYAAGVADYTCDGVNDDAQFQDPLDPLPPTGGKLVILTGT